jgi:hypothetical protein
VLEPWITPSIFEGHDAIDEYTMVASIGKEAAQSKLRDHWNSWITQDDFNQMAGKLSSGIGRRCWLILCSCWSQPCSHSYRLLEYYS